jgi:hypothetical protein
MYFEIGSSIERNPIRSPLEARIAIDGQGRNEVLVRMALDEDRLMRVVFR